MTVQWIEKYLLLKMHASYNILDSSYLKEQNAILEKYKEYYEPKDKKKKSE